MIMSKSQFELSLVRPGNLTTDGQDSSIRYDEDRIKLLKVVMVEKIKGTLSVNRDMLFIIFIEIKLLMLKLRSLGEIGREKGLTSGCFKLDLDSLDCRAGCNICFLNEMVEKIMINFDLEEGPGMTVSYVTLFKNAKANQ